MNSVLTRLFLIRHAEVEARYQNVFGGRVDMEISPRGHEQAAALADFLRREKIDAIYASPMKRVQQTLAPLLNNGAPTPIISPDLREVDFGDWTGHGWDAVKEKFGASPSSGCTIWNAEPSRTPNRLMHIARASNLASTKFWAAIQGRLSRCSVTAA
jgi:broad specificity phosphatase PhoE